MTTKPYPIIDLHCDLPIYLAKVVGAHPNTVDDIGCALPHLQNGNVKLQVMAIYSGGGDDATTYTQPQCDWLTQLATEYSDSFVPVRNLAQARNVLDSSKIGIIAAVENGSAICDEDEPLASGLERLESVRSQVGPLLYISLTHHGENRFGGGNMTEAGLKPDGKTLLDYLNGKHIAIDLSHTSDALAYGIIDHIDKQGLDLPIIASHSNFRAAFDFPRNLPDELARIVIERQGIIGVNFVRGFLDPEDPSALTRHILHGLGLGGREALCFGADYFYFKDYPHPEQGPFFFEEHDNAGKYPQILRGLEAELGEEQLQAMTSGNALRFLERLWPTQD